MFASSDMAMGFEPCIELQEDHTLSMGWGNAALQK